jgi:hypothetical protein
MERLLERMFKKKQLQSIFQVYKKIQKILFRVKFKKVKLINKFNKMLSNNLEF